ncbi:MAG: autotransporter-associated beta strand repeat-containing protein [Verrucomicrobiota bacterium]
MKFRPNALFARQTLLACTAVCAVSSAYAQNGTWTGVTSFTNWSDTTNWSGGVVANGSGNTADFSTIDVPDGIFYAVVDSPRTIGNLTFGDTNLTTVGSWHLDGNFDPFNILTLAGAPVVTVNALGTGAYADLALEVSGVAGLTKAGPGHLAMSGLNTYSGGTTLNAGTLSLNTATAIGTGPLTIAGGSLDSLVATVLTTNNTQSWNSDFSFTGTANLNLGAGAVLVPAARIVTTNAGVLNVGGVITSASTFTKDGAGELLLNGSNAATFTGPLTLKGGTLRIRGAVAQSATGAALDQTPLGSTTRTITFEGGALAVNGSTGSNGPTVGQVLQPMVIATGQTGTIYTAQRGDFNSTVTGAGTFNIVGNYVRGNMNGNWLGFTGIINAASAGAGNSDWRINGANMLHANMHLNVTNASVIQVYNPPNNAIGTTHQIGKLSGTAAAFMGGSSVGGRFVNWQVGALNQDSEYAGVIANSAGAARLYKVGTGSLTLSGNNTYTGDTQLNAGKLIIGTGGAAGSLGLTNVISLAGTEIAFNRDDSAVSTYGGILSGPAVVRKQGAGQVNFNGANTYTAGTLIEGGTIGINSTSSLGNTAGAVSFSGANGGVVATAPGVISGRSFTIGTGITASFGGVNAADSLEITSSITGAGALGVKGDGVFTLSADNTYAGNTTVTSGSLVVANASGSATSAGAVTLTSGKLGGTGSIAGAVSTATGVELKPGPVTPTSSAVGTLTVGGLSLAGGTVMRFELSDALNFDKVVVTGSNALTSSASLANPVWVDPRFANSTAKWTSPGNFNIIEFSGSFVGNANDLFEVPVASRQPGLTYSFAVVGNAIQLQIGGSPPSTWNVDASGNWTDSGNWLNGSPNGVGAFADFNSAISSQQAVMMLDNRTLGFMQFNNSNAYTIDGNFTITLNQTVGNAEISVLSGSHAIASKLSLTDSLNVTLFSANDTLSLLGDISGAGGINKSSVGNLVLGGSNSFLGDIVFSNGVLTFAEFALGGGNLTLDNAALVWAPGNFEDITTRTITFGNNPVTFSMTDDVVLANDFGLTGLANLQKDGTGTLTLTADTTFTGDVVVLNGNLNLGSGGTTGSTLGGIDLANAASVLTINRSGDPVISNIIYGAGNLVLAGPGAQSLVLPNAFTGTTTISNPSGSLVTVDGQAIQSSKLVYNNSGGTVDFDFVLAATFGALEGNKSLVLNNKNAEGVVLTAGGNGATTSYTGTLSGLGSFTKAGAGIMTLTAPQTYTGATTINGGALELDPTVTITAGSVINVNPTGRLTLTGASVSAPGLSNVASGSAGGAVLELFSGASASFPGGLNALGNGTTAYLINVNSGTLSAGSMALGRSGIFTAEPAAAGTGDGLQITGGDVDITGALDMGLTGAANSSVTVRMDAGSLDIAGAVTVGLNNGGRWSVIDVAGGVFNSTDTVTGVRLGGPFQGNAAFLSRGGVSTVERFQFGQGALGGSSTVHVSGGELYVGSGGMVVGTSEAGFVSTLRLSGGILAAKESWSTAIPVATSAAFTIKAANAANVAQAITLSGAVTGTGTLMKEGAGTLTLSGAYSYTGETLVNQGTLVLSTATLDDLAAVDIASGAVLNLPHGTTDTVSEFRINGVAQGAGTFTSANSGGRITGSGSLKVVGTEAFSGWIDGFAALTNPADKAKDADPDHDGMNNLQEFAFDGDPTSAATSGKVRSRIETVGAEQALVITLPVRVGTGDLFIGSPFKTATRDEVIYTIQGSNTLGVFDQGVTEIAESSVGMPPLSGAEWVYKTFRLDGAIGGVTPRGPRGFLRAVTQNGGL